MIEEIRCPQCGSAGREVDDSGRVLCTNCGAIFGVGRESAESAVPCPQCGFSNLTRAYACKQCGTPLAKYCPRCGARLELRMRFCDQCGANHEDVSSPDGRCHWCGLANSRDSELCTGCGARLITVCPRCGSKMKAGLNYCAACGMDYEQLIQDQTD